MPVVRGGWRMTDYKFVRGDRVARCACGHIQLDEAEGVTKIQHCRTCRVTITVKVRNGKLTYGERRT